MKEQKTKKKFWKKIKNIAIEAGSRLLEKAFTLYYCLIDKDTPMLVKSSIIVALTYFISPMDAIPDVIVGIGYTDDASVIAAAYASVSAHIKPEHIEKAKNQIETIFGKTSNNEAFA